MNYCACCGKEMPEGDHICFSCKQIANEDRLPLLDIMISDLESEARTYKHNYHETLRKLYTLKLMRKKV